MIPLPPEPMTIEQLKAHMDRRFDRLERTKADRRELRRLGERVDRCATKADLRRFATKEYLKRFATKEDLTRFATKEDLKRFATKEDLKRFATKEDLKRFATKEDFKGLARGLARLEDRMIAMQATLHGIAKHHGLILDDHEARIADLERHG